MYDICYLRMHLHLQPHPCSCLPDLSVSTYVNPCQVSPTEWKPGTPLCKLWPKMNTSKWLYVITFGSIARKYVLQLLVLQVGIYFIEHYCELKGDKIGQFFKFKVKRYLMSGLNMYLLKPVGTLDHLNETDLGGWPIN